MSSLTSMTLSKPILHQMASVRAYDRFQFLGPVRRWLRTQLNARGARPGCRTCKQGPRRELTDSVFEATVASLEGAYANEVHALKSILDVKILILPYRTGAVTL